MFTCPIGEHNKCCLCSENDGGQHNNSGHLLGVSVMQNGTDKLNLVGRIKTKGQMIYGFLVFWHKVWKYNKSWITLLISQEYFLFVNL